MAREPVSKLEWLTGLRATDLTHAEFRVLVVLFTYTDATLSNAYPSKATLAEAASVTPLTLTRALRALRKKGYAQIIREGGNQHGKGRANVWALTTPEAPKGAPEVPPSVFVKGVTEVPPSEGVKGVTEVPPSNMEGGHSVTTKGVTEYQGRGSLSNPPSGPRSGHKSGDARVEPSVVAESADTPPPIRCPKHIHDPNPPACHACGQARRAHETWQTEQRQAEQQAASDAARARAELRRQQIDGCHICDESGYIGKAQCHHDPMQAETNNRGLEKAWAAIGGRKPR